MPSSQPSKRVIHVGSSRYPAEGSFGNWTADGVHATTFDGLQTKLTRRAEKRVEMRGREQLRHWRGGSHPENPAKERSNAYGQGDYRQKEDAKRRQKQEDAKRRKSKPPAPDLLGFLFPSATKPAPAKKKSAWDLW